MLEVIRDKQSKEFFLINGKRIIDCEIVDLTDSIDELEYFITIWQREDFDFVLEDASYYSRIVGIECPVYEKWKGINISARVDFEDGFYGVFKVSFERWKWNFSPQQYFTEFVRILGNQFVDIEVNESDSFITSVGVVFRGTEAASSVTGEFNKIFLIINKFHWEVVHRLENEKSEDSILNTFNFPKEFKIPCEQYLLYFAQFLQDLGINATSNLKEEAGKVLFSVTPTDDIEALDKIREALAVYLNLPSSPIVYDESFAAMRLQQQVENLQHSQKMAVREIRSAERELRLAQTVIEHQDKIITQKDSIIEQQNKVIEKISSKSIMIDSLENKEELEEIYEGLKIGESKFLKEHLGIHLNPAKVIKAVVKNTFGKDGEKKSVLGLDEET